MTLIVAIGCSDGVVLAADSAATDADSGLKQPAVKIRPVPGQPFLYGGSGDVGLLQKIDEALAGFPARGTINALRKELKRRVAPELAESVQLHVPYPHPAYNMPPTATLLFAGVLNRAPWILEIERNGGDTIFSTVDFGHFGAIGSGKPLAQAIFRTHLRTERDLRLGKIFAYRVIDDAIELSASGLAQSIHIHTAALDGTIETVGQEELDGLRDTCALWRQTERDALGRALAPEPVEEPAPDVPEPQ